MDPTTCDISLICGKVVADVNGNNLSREYPLLVSLQNVSIADLLAEVESVMLDRANSEEEADKATALICEISSFLHMKR